MTPGATGAVPIDAQRLTSVVADIFTACGIAVADAQIVAADLVAADLEGIASHGVMLVPMYVERIKKGSVSRRSAGEVVSDRAGAIPILSGGGAIGNGRMHGVPQVLECYLQLADRAGDRQRKNADIAVACYGSPHNGGAIAFSTEAY